MHDSMYKREQVPRQVWLRARVDRDWDAGAPFWRLAWRGPGEGLRYRIAKDLPPAS